MPEKKHELSEVDKKIISAMNCVVFLPGSYDKRFYNSVSFLEEITEKQRVYLRFIFNKYRRQIKNYEPIAFEMDPDRFNVNVEFNKDLFSTNGRAEIKFTDTFKPTRFKK